MDSSNTNTSPQREADSGSPTNSGPLQSLNSSLKRIRLEESGSEAMSRSDSYEQEWGAIDLGELDENDASPQSELPTVKKARKESEEAEDSDDDFIKAVPNLDVKDTEERSIFSEHTTVPGRTTSSILERSVKPTVNRTITKSKGVKSTSRTNSGMEDVFTHDQVKSWSEVRIKTWEHRRTNVEGFYYRFVDPTEGQQNGPWSKKSTEQFMERLQEWKDRGIRIGTSWGVLSMGVSHKAGYQCSSYYRKLLENKTLTDPAYEWREGKLVMVNKSSGGEMAVSGLSERWETPEVKEIEANIKAWIKEYHSNPAGRSAGHSKVKKAESTGSGSGSPFTKVSATKTTTTTTITTTASRSGLHFRPTTEAPRVKATTAAAVPKVMSLRPSKNQPIDESEMIPVVDINDKLAEYSSFMKKTSSISHDKIRESMSLKVSGTISSTSSPIAKGIVPIEVRKAPLTTNAQKGQTGLSLFWKNIRPVRVECPDVPRYIIPKDVEQRPTWAHRIQPFVEPSTAPVEGATYKEVRSMNKLDWASLSEGFSERVADIQGILADPPWNFIVDDGRNDGACRLTMIAFEGIMEKALEMMPNGIVSIWTHKAILPEVVSMMHRLGCRYVENLVWYKLGLNNANLDRASPYFRNSKEILLMFKRGEGFDIRHQRTADVIMDFEPPTSAWIHEEYTEPKPEAVFEMMEIMLPDAKYIPEVGRGRLLELWAKKSQTRRPGWISIHETKISNAEFKEMEADEEKKMVVDDELAEPQVKAEPEAELAVEEAMMNDFEEKDEPQVIKIDQVLSDLTLPERPIKASVSGTSTPNSLEDLDESILDELVNDDMDLDL